MVSLDRATQGSATLPNNSVPQPQTKLGLEETRKKMEDIFKIGIDEFFTFQRTNPTDYQEWRAKTDSSPFELALKYKNVRLIRCIAAVEDLNDEVSKEHQATDLQLAVRSGDIVTINTIAARGLRKDAVDHDGHDMAYYAALSGNSDVAKLIASWSDSKKRKAESKEEECEGIEGACRRKMEWIQNLFANLGLPQINWNNTPRFDEKVFKETQTKVENLCKNSGPEEFIAFQKANPKEYGHWRLWLDKRNGNCPPFGLCVVYQNIKLARYLAQTESLIDDDYIHNDDHTATDLHLAVGLGDIETIYILLKRGLKINSIDDDGHNMMHYAALSGKIEIVKLVSCWDYLKDFSKKDDHYPVPEVFWAAEAGNLECLKYMLNNLPKPLQRQVKLFEQHAYDYYTNIDKNPLKSHFFEGTILHFGVRSGKKDVVEYLVNAGVDPLLVSGNAYPIYEAADKGFLGIVRYLWPICKARGMKIDDRCNSLIFGAVEKGNNLELVKYLVEQGASLKCKDYRQIDLISLVKDPKYQNKEIREYILGLVGTMS